MREYNVIGIVRLRMAAGKTGQLTVPSKFMQNLTKGSYFRPEWTEDGILFRFMGETLQEAHDVPAWTKDGKP